VGGGLWQAERCLCGSSIGYRRVVFGAVVAFLEWRLVEWDVKAEARNLEEWSRRRVGIC
jgi:hypothetical protein